MSNKYSTYGSAALAISIVVSLVSTKTRFIFETIDGFLCKFCDDEIYLGTIAAVGFLGLIASVFAIKGLRKGENKIFASIVLALGVLTTIGTLAFVAFIFAIGGGH